MTNKNVLVVDSVMGSGKTSWVIDYMNQHPEMNFIYITPNLIEVNRIKENCNDFNEPVSSENVSKTKALKKLLDSDATHNIVMTHSLFTKMDDDCVMMIGDKEYHIIIDESLDCFKRLIISKQDIELMLEKRIIVKDEDERNRVYFNDSDEMYVEMGDTLVHKYAGLAQYEKYAKYIRNKEIFTTDTNALLIALFPSDVFTVAESVTVLSYNFANSEMDAYLKFNHLTTSFKSVSGDRVSGYSLVSYIPACGKEFKRLVNIYNGRSNNIGNRSKTSLGKGIPLSKSWYQNSSPLAKKKVSNAAYNFFKNHTKTSPEFNMVTVYNDGHAKVRKIDADNYQYEAGDGNYVHIKSSILRKPFLTVGKINLATYHELSEEEQRLKHCFVPFNIRATNIYRHKTACAFLVDAYTDHSVKSFFKQYDIELSDDTFLLNTIIQWLWRSAIREGRQVHLFIPSQRARKILMKWLGYEDSEVF